MPLQDVIFENSYKYKAKQSHFDKENEETVEISCDVMVTCDAGELIVYMTFVDIISSVLLLLLGAHAQRGLQ